MALSFKTASKILPLLALAMAGSAAAIDPIVGAKGWRQIAYDRQGECEAEIRTNGQTILLNAAGLPPSAQASLFVANGDMQPIDRPIRTSASGQWSEYYIPFRPQRSGGDVQVVIAAEDCSLSLITNWSRGIMVIEPDGSRKFIRSEPLEW